MCVTHLPEINFKGGSGISREVALESNRPSLNAAHHFPSCITLDKLFNLSELVFFSRKMGGMTVPAS